MSGLVWSTERRGDVLTVWLYSRGGWPKAERIARETLSTGEAVERVEQFSSMFRFRVVTS